MTKGYGSLGSLQTLALDFGIHIELLGRMNDFHRESGSERLTGVQTIIAVTKLYDGYTSKTILLNFFLH